LLKDHQDIKVIDEGVGHKKYTLENIFKASINGFKAADFHRTCKGVDNLLSII